MKKFFVYILVSIFGISVVVVASEATDQQNDVIVDSLKNQVKEKADLAIEQFQARAGGKLDYTPESLDTVEVMLDEASNFVDGMPPENIKAISELMGSYVLYVAYTEHGGKFYWSDKANQPVLVVGEPDFKVALITFDKVRDRLHGDAADNIPYFYKGFSDHARKAESGTNVLYI